MFLKFRGQSCPPGAWRELDGQVAATAGAGTVGWSCSASVPRSRAPLAGSAGRSPGGPDEAGRGCPRFPTPASEKARARSAEGTKARAPSAEAKARAPSAEGTKARAPSPRLLVGGRRAEGGGGGAAEGGGPGGRQWAQADPVLLRGQRMPGGQLQNCRRRNDVGDGEERLAQEEGHVLGMRRVESRGGFHGHLLGRRVRRARHIRYEGPRGSDGRFGGLGGGGD